MEKGGQMSYLTSEEQVYFCGATQNRDCTLCGKPTDPPLIFWLAGRAGGDLWLHPSCAASLVMRLGGDILEHKRETGEDLKFTPMVERVDRETPYLS